MIAVFAEELNIPVADLEARLDQGETMAQIAVSTGLTVDEFRTLMVDARTQAIDQAVTDGTLTQEQADWMKQRSAGQMAGGQMGNGRGMGAPDKDSSPTQIVLTTTKPLRKLTNSDTTGTPDRGVPVCFSLLRKPIIYNHVLIPGNFESLA